MSPKVVMVALDALDRALLERLAASGRLPNLRRFMDEAHGVTVESDGVSLHGSLWPTFAAGRGPGHHGRYFWNQWLSEEMRHVRNDHPSLEFEPFWAALAPAGMTATVVDVPYVPPVRVPGFRSFAGWGLHDEMIPTSYPDGFGKAITKEFGRSPLGFDTVEPHDANAKHKMVRRLSGSTRTRMEILQSLVAKEPTDLVLITVGETHKAAHYLSAPEQLTADMDNEAGMAAILQEVDAAWPVLQKSAGPDCHVILFALHGTEQQVDYSHFITQLLALLNGDDPTDDATNRDLVRRLRDMLPGWVHRGIWNLLPARTRAARVGNLTLATTDLARDELFRVLHDGHAALRINLQGRENPGLVSAEAGEALIAQLAEQANAFSTDDGQPAFVEMMRSQGAFPGPRSHRLPDALLMTNPSVKGTRALHSRDITLRSEAREARNGVHTGRGFCYLRAATGVGVEQASMNNKDFAPTVLGLLGVPPTTTLDGTSILS